MERRADNRKEAIYARQSLDKKESLSIETQIEECKAKCKTKDPLIFEDKGYSGKNTKRPELQELLEQIKANKIKKVIVYKLDRISRNTTDFFNLHTLMKEHKCEFQSVNEEFDSSTTTGNAMMSFIAIFAQMERENIQQRVKDNYYFRAKEQGTWLGGPAPYGFKNGRTKDNKPTLIIDDVEIEAVKLMFKKYADKSFTSLGKLADILKEEGYVSRKRKVFDNVTIARILQNPIYARANKTLYKFYKSRRIQFANTESEWDGTTSAAIIGKRVNNCNIRAYTDLSEQTIYLTNIKGIISSDIFVKVQRKLRRNRQFTSANKPTILKELAGKLKCGHCQYAIKSYSRNKSGKPYLSCYGNKSLKICDKPLRGLDFNKLRIEIGEQIQPVLDDLNEVFRKHKLQKKKMNKKIEELQEEIKNLIGLLAKAKSEKAQNDILDEIEKREEEITNLELELNLQLDIIDDFENLPFFDIVDKKIIKYHTLDDENKKIIVNHLIDKIYVYDKDNIEIIWKV